MAEKKEGSILIVDDDEGVRNFLASFLSAEFGCATAGGAEAAVKLLASRYFHVVITDLQMPKVTGIELCKIVQSIYPEIAIIVMSGTGDIKARVEAMKNGALYFIDKPFNTSQVQRLVESALSSRLAGAARRGSDWQSTGETFAVRAATGPLRLP